MIFWNLKLINLDLAFLVQGCNRGLFAIKPWLCPSREERIATRHKKCAMLLLPLLLVVAGPDKNLYAQEDSPRLKKEPYPTGEGVGTG